jgi:site-specific DNA-cytosine methylase
VAKYLQSSYYHPTTGGNWGSQSHNTPSMRCITVCHNAADNCCCSKCARAGHIRRHHNLHRTPSRCALESLGPPSDVYGHTLHTAAARVCNGRAPSDMDKPGHAVVSSVDGCPGGANTARLYGWSVRCFTPREMARLQSSPVSFVLPTTWSTAVRQLGNAAAPSLIYAFTISSFASTNRLLLLQPDAHELTCMSDS